MSQSQTTNNNGTQQPPQPAAGQKSVTLQRIDALQLALDADYVKNQLEGSLGDMAPVFKASLVELVTSDKYLQECEPKRVVFEAMKAAALRLPVNKVLGFAWIIAYNKVPTFQIGYKGLIQLAVRSGYYETINADVVYEGEFRRADKISGAYDISGTATSDKVIGYFAHFKLKNGFYKTLYSTVAQVTAHAKKYSKSWGKQGSAWVTDFDAMGKKTLIRGLLSHWGLLSVEMTTAIEQDSDYDAADEVKKDIKARANTQTTGFSDFEVVGEDKKQDDTTTKTDSPLDPSDPKNW